MAEPEPEADQALAAAGNEGIPPGQALAAEGIPPGGRQLPLIPVPYLHQVAAAPQPGATWMCPGAPPTPLEAAQRRLAVAMLMSHRLSAEAYHVHEVDVAEQIGCRLLGFDHFAELGKLQRFGEEAANARSGVVPAGRHNHYDSAGLIKVGLTTAREIPAVGWLWSGAVTQAAGIVLTGHTAILQADEYNGTYRAVDERDGWPVLQNEHGMWLFRPSAASGLSHRWFIWREHTPAVDQCYSYIDAPDGSFPVGEQTWKVWERDGFVDRPLTMRVVV